MKIELNINPNFPDERAVQFEISIEPSEEEDDGDDLQNFFLIRVLGAIPENDSVIELRKMALTKARALLERLVASTEF